MTPFATADVTLSMGEFVRVSLYIFWRQFRWLALIFAVMTVLALLPVLVPPSRYSLDPLAFVPVVAISALAFLTYVSAVLAFRRLPPDRLHYIWRFYEDRIETSSDKASAVLRWELFTRIHETSGLLLFFVQGNLCHVVPIHALLSRQSLSGVREKAVSVLGKKAKVHTSESA